MEKKRLISTCVILLCAMFVQDVSAQYYRNQGNWKKNRIHICGGIGVSNFLGELGGRNQEGSGFIWDLETKQFKPALSAGIRYFVHPRVAIRGQFSYTTLAGDDALTTERFRSNRNLHFRSKLLELSALLELNLHNVRPGHRYSLSGAQGRKPRAANIYAFVGVAGISFNPQGKLGEEWIDLQPLGTEGQGLDRDLEEYSLYSIAIPFGIGYRAKMAGDFFLGIEIGHRLTFTDYIDDVSTEYYNNDSILFNSGLEAAFFADPSLGYFIDPETGEQVNENMSQTGEQRGDPNDNDSYLFAQFTISYIMKSKPYKLRKGPRKKKGRKVVF